MLGHKLLSLNGFFHRTEIILFTHTFQQSFQQTFEDAGDKQWKR